MHLSVNCWLLLPLLGLVLSGEICDKITSCDRVTCLQQVLPSHCKKVSGTVFSAKAALCGCCPACVKYRGVDDSCDSTLQFEQSEFSQVYSLEQAIPAIIPKQVPVVESNSCGPGLECKSTKKCGMVVNYGCLDEQKKQDASFKPDCDGDTSYAAVQCKGSNPDSRCHCVDKYGQRIFGSDWYPKRSSMTCACSRLVNELKPSMPDLSLHCSANGNFEPLQCNQGICYCVNQTTGVPTSPFVTESVWTILPCYNETITGSYYLRQCESLAVAQAQLRSEVRKHGAIISSLATYACDPDGSYYPKQCTGDQCACYTKDNVRTQYATQTGTDQEIEMTCVCARDKSIYAAEGYASSFTCQGNGNYAPIQYFSNYAYCVDSDGYQTGEYRERSKVCCLSCYSPNCADDPSKGC